MRRLGLLQPGVLPLTRDTMRWHLAVVLAVVTYVVLIAGMGLIVLRDQAHDWQQALGGTLTLQLPEDTSPARLEVALALLRQTPGIAAAQPLTPADTARLLEPWLGKSAPVDIMPLPQLVDIRIDWNRAPDLTGLEQRLRSVAPGAQLEDHRLWLARLLGAAARLRRVAIAAIAVACGAALLSAAITAATGTARNDQRIAFVHALGADEFDLAGALVLPAGGSGLLGGAIGALAAAGTWQAVVAAVRRLGLAASAPAVTDHRAILLLAGTVVASGIVGAVPAGIAAWRRLSRLP